ncbi:MAG TPA: 50S ribosomal protein L11 methyltransferase [Burkholderiales bacterium]|nr:50S ribosomal protein L11 methyltransferase [Burkholderiales bacterium]
MAWLALTLEVDEAHAEAFSDALLEAGAISVSIEDAEAGSAFERARFAEPGWSTPATWHRNRVQALLDPGADCNAVVAAAAGVAGLGTPPAFARSRVDEQDWVRASQAQFPPLAVGDRLWIVPTWHEPPDPQAVVVRLDPGLAFGTGSHPTTRLVLAWLERTIASLPPMRPAEPNAPASAAGKQDEDGSAGERSGLSFPATSWPASTRLRVLDYGCGSGILAIVAAKLGAGKVDAVDLDPQALETTAHNALRNCVAVGTAAPETLPAGDYDVVVANILANPLVLLQPALARRTCAGGRIALSGILVSQATAVIDAYAPDFDLAAEGEEQGWVLLAGHRRAAGSAAAKR